MEVMNRAGISPRHKQAHMDSCLSLKTMQGKKIALSYAERFAQNAKVLQRGRDRFTLLLCGGLGTGKTWLATAAFKDILWREKNGMWRKFYKFVREVQSCYNAGAKYTADEIISRYQRTPLLLLDDVGDMEITTETEDRKRLLYEVLDSRSDYLLPTIITTNLGPAELENQFGERTFQRILEMSALVEMSGENFRLQEAA